MMVPIAFEDNQFTIESCYVELRHVVFLEYLNYKLGSFVVALMLIHIGQLQYFERKATGALYFQWFD
jgi:hypothetical protein